MTKIINASCNVVLNLLILVGLGSGTPTKYLYRLKPKTIIKSLAITVKVNHRGIKPMLCRVRKSETNNILSAAGSSTAPT